MINILYFPLKSKILRPCFCKRCKKHNSFHHHSKYYRKKLFSKTGWLTNIFIFRFRCKYCKSIVSVFPQDYVLYRQAVPSVESMAHSTYSDIVKDAFSPRTLTRWRTRLRVLAETFSSKVHRIIFFKFPDTDTRSEHSTVFDNLSQLLKQHYKANSLEILVHLLGTLNLSHKWSLPPPQTLSVDL